MTAQMCTMAVESPIGPLLLASDGRALTGIFLPGSRPLASGADQTPPRVLLSSAEQLSEYFAGDRTRFDIPTSLDGTDFQRAVWGELARIPYGTTITYGELARRIGRPTSFRAVGQANGRNRIPIVVPCHRVVAGDGIGGYSGGLEIKRALLAVEGYLLPG
ncbi:MAG TPA: methylated-DNA--[protein]-cysteine S-methyltransferase [Acidimicrobiales bacterium]|nr:methylated-DNA--[protein]-cysteine S-methyltransferase [Acidimicrobiales bacterium]